MYWENPHPSGRVSAQSCTGKCRCQRVQLLQGQLEQNSQARLQLEAEKVAIEREKVKNDKDYNDKLIETKQQQVQIQAAETVDTNPYNDKIKQVVQENL
jgi:hypothetical protein